MQQLRQNHQFEIVIRPKGEEDSQKWHTLSGESEKPPSLAPYGAKLEIAEKEWPDGTVAQSVMAASVNGGEPVRLNKFEWESPENSDWEFRCVPKVISFTAPWAKDPIPEAEHWKSVKDKIEEIKREHPFLRLALLPFPGARRWLRELYDDINEKYRLDRCGDCKFWDRQEGYEEYMKVTHHFDGGKIGQLNRDVARMEAEAHGVPNIDEEKLGYCAKRKALIESTFRACPDFEPKR